MTTGISTEVSASHCAEAYSRIAPFYDLLDAPYEYLWKRRLRARVFSGAAGRILDLGVGTGSNMPFYPAGAAVVGLDISREMLATARRRARRLRREVDLLQGDAADTGLPDGSFDSVVATFVFCCIEPDRQLGTLREMLRLAGPSGRIHLLDYTLARRQVLRAFMRFMSPWMKAMFSGRYDNHPEPHFAAAGLKTVERRDFMGGAVALHVLRAAGPED